MTSFDLASYDELVGWAYPRGLASLLSVCRSGRAWEQAGNHLWLARICICRYVNVRIYTHV